MAHSRTFLAGAAAAIIGVGAMVGCAGDSNDQSLPSNAAARVGDAVITEREVVRYFKATMVDQGLDPAGFMPPLYSECMAHKRRVTPDRTESNLREQCAFELKAKQADALQFLVRSEWLKKEGDRRDLRLSDAELNERLDAQPISSSNAFPDQPRLTRADLLRRVETADLDQRLLATTPVPDRLIARFYKQSPKQFSHPEQRQIHVVLTRGRTAAGRARDELESGGGWKQVARRYSVDSESKLKGGRLTLLEGFSADRAAGKLFFAAPTGALIGPTKASMGWYVFRVDKVVASSRNSLDEVSEGIETLLRQDEMNRWLVARYHGETSCAKRYRIPLVPECLEHVASLVAR